MPKKSSVRALHPREIEQAIKVVRGHRVILDSDLARFYGVTTAAINKLSAAIPKGSLTIFLFLLHSKSLQL